MTGERPLDRLADAYGVERRYLSEAKEWRTPSDEAKRAVLEAMGVAARDADAIADSLDSAPMPPDGSLTAPPGAQCHLPAWLAKGRAWGVTCQLYGLRSARNHGIGDFEDLARLAECAAAVGADFLGVNPLHALFTAAPEHRSPFSPSNRRFLNPLYIALDKIPGIALPPRFAAAERTRLCAEPWIDYPAVATLKFDALRDLWQRIADEPGSWTSEARADFDAFVAARGAPLLAHARFEALSHRMVADGLDAGWLDWPDAWHNADGEAVRRFTAEHDDEIRFHLWLQWIADAQLGSAAQRARAAGMRIGLYLDFAVGNAPDGSATWSDPALVVPGANIGAPPDSLFQGGQDWGLAPLSPAALRARQLGPYRDVLETVMRHAGAIRIDHAMGLHRLFWIPHGMEADAGCYVRYPMADMLRALAEVSRARQSLVIGEDLGTVPDGFRDMMRDANMLSCRILYFEHTRRGFRAVASYPRNALLSASTHDLPPLAAWWTAQDVDLYGELGMIDVREAERRRTARGRDRRALIARLRAEADKDPFHTALPAEEGDPGGPLTPELAAAIHAYLARTRARLLAVQFEDLCGAEAPVNVPGTSNEYPNWRLRAPATIDDAVSGAHWQAIVEAVARERPGHG